MDTFAGLDDVELVAATRIAEYMVVYPIYSQCIEDVFVQRQIRAGQENTLLQQELPQMFIRVQRRCRDINMLVDLDVTANSPLPAEATLRTQIIRGQRMPATREELTLAIKWGHIDNCKKARADGCEWHSEMAFGAAAGGQHKALQVSPSPHSKRVIMWFAINACVRCSNWRWLASPSMPTSCLLSRPGIILTWRCSRWNMALRQAWRGRGWRRRQRPATQLWCNGRGPTAT